MEYRKQPAISSLHCISSPRRLLLNLETRRGILALEPLRKAAVLLPFSSCAQDPSRCDDGPRSQASRLAGSESLPNSFVTALSLSPSLCPSRWMERYLFFLSLVKRGREGGRKKTEEEMHFVLAAGRRVDGRAGGTSAHPSIRLRASVVRRGGFVP